MGQPYLEESIYTEYKHVIEVNKAKRLANGKGSVLEPPEIIFDETCEGDDIVPWWYSNLLSDRCVQDIFGDDTISYKLLLQVTPEEMVFVGDDIYYREQYIRKVLDILRLLAKSPIVNSLRPIPQTIKGIDKPVYSNDDLMRILGVKETTLRKFRKEGWITYHQPPGSDKIWYTEKDLEDFLHNPKISYKAWKS